MPRGRTPNIVNLEDKAEKLTESIKKHRRLIEEQTKELADVRERIENLNSPEYVAQLEALAERKKAELERVTAQLAKRKAEAEKSEEVVSE